MLMSPRKLTLIVTLVGASVTVLIAVLPFVQFAYRSPAGHLALDTVAGFIALLTAYMVLGRLRRLGLASDFLMAYSLAVFGFTNLFLSAAADIVAGPERQLFSTWSVLGARFVAATTFMVSAFLPETRLIRNRSRGLLVVVGALITVIAMAALEATIGSRLARAIPPNLSPTNLVRPLIVGHPTVLGLQLIMMAMFAVAAVTFTRRAERTGDELLKWFGAAAALGAFARANYFLFPSLYSHYLYTGDLLRLGFYALLLVGATREIGRYWGSLAEVAVLEERRRLARDLHDGLGQELSFIWRESRRFQDGNASLILQRVSSAAERALEESRLAVAALTRPIDEPLHLAVARAAHDVAHRVGVSVKHDLERGVIVGPDVRHALLRVVREAVVNAVRHGRASMVTIRLTAANGLRLEVHDDGLGFDPSAAAATSTGFGLSSMRERVAVYGGSLEVDSSPGRGALVTVVLPDSLLERPSARNDHGRSGP